MDEWTETLLQPDEPPAVTVMRADGKSDFFFTCEHAGNRIPRRLGTLGLGPKDLGRHIAWDIGAKAVSEGLSDRLDATLVCQTYSRLVIDCNRSPDVPAAILAVSEATEVPGNQKVSPREAAARTREVFHPYHDRIEALLDQRAASGRTSILVTLHSFTPSYHGVTRPWHIGLLYNRDARLAKAMFEVLANEPDLCVGDNEPYAVEDESDYTVPVHGERRGIPHIEIEIRQDLIEHAEGQREWADRLARVFLACRDGLTP